MKFDQPTCEAILQDLREEIPYKFAAESNGIPLCTFMSWLRYGLEEIKNGKSEARFAQFLLSVRKIEKERIKRHLNNIGEDGKSHRGSEWILERSFWKYFGKVAEIELNERVEALESKQGNADVEKEEREVSDEESKA